MSLFYRKFCADDWGLSPAINDSIIELVKCGILGSVSVMTDGEFLDYRLKELLTLPVVFNLHFNLTYPSNRLSLLFKPKKLHDEFRRQMKICHQKNIPVTVLDGHQHVHLLPGILNVIAGELRANPELKIRIMLDRSHLGSFVLGIRAQTILKKAGLTAAILPYGYLRKKDIRQKKTLEKKLAAFHQIICHPSVKDDFEQYKIYDKLRSERISEFTFLRGLSDVRIQ